jgi:PAS domain S-box-containing protein
MVDGMVVLDARGRVADLNPAAQDLLGAPRSQVIGKDAAQVLAAFPDLARLALNPAAAQVDVLLRTSEAQRWYNVGVSPLANRRGFRLGRLILLQDVTQQKHARELLLQQERTLSVMQERERLARELHDGLGQMLAASHLQASTARRLLAQGATAETDECLERLAETTLEAEADVREYLLGAKTAFSAEHPFFPSLRQYLGRFSQQYGLEVDLAVPPQLEAQGLDPALEVQLLRIIQEALSNVRKHAHVLSAQVTFAIVGLQVRITIADDGQGFDPAVVARQSEGFGLRAMRERAEGMGGTLTVTSSSGQGTQVMVEIPMGG